MLVPARAGLRVAEYAPNAVKKAVIGVGHGEKQQIHMMLKSADAEGGVQGQRRGRRARHRHLPRPQPQAAALRPAKSLGGLVCS